MKAYEPSGMVRLLLEAVKDEPSRIFTVSEAAKVMGISSVRVYGSIAYAVRAGVLHRGTKGGVLVLSGSPLAEELPLPKQQQDKNLHRKPVAAGWATDPSDPRIGKVIPGWVPPQMVCVRGA